MDIRVSDAVQQARQKGVGVVALESTIITHGMPYPENIETAQSVESLIKQEGCIPATIAVLDGQLRIGLEDHELKHLAQAVDVMKLSRADLAFAISTGATGSTTVAATMISAALAGIEYFATGGIGGVHRGAGQSMDVSADLLELARTPVTVVCAGAKAILDIGLTLEVLETHGVPVVTFDSNQFPAFWSRHSGHASPLNLSRVEDLDTFLYTRRKLQLQGGVLIANPVPVEDEIPLELMQHHIDTALEDADKADVKGKAVTPFLLSRISELTEGHSLQCNIALVKNNARLAAQLAFLGASRATQ